MPVNVTTAEETAAFVRQHIQRIEQLEERVARLEAPPDTPPEDDVPIDDPDIVDDAPALPGEMVAPMTSTALHDPVLIDAPRSLVVAESDREYRIAARVGRLEVPAGVARVRIVGAGGELGELRIGDEHQAGAVATDVVVRGLTIRTPGGPWVHGIIARAHRLVVEDCTILTARYCVFVAEGEDLQFHRCRMVSAQVHNAGVPVHDQAAFRVYGVTRLWATDLSIEDPDRHCVRFHGSCHQVLLEVITTVGGGWMLGDDGAGTPVDLSDIYISGAHITHTTPPGNGGFLVKPVGEGSIRLLTVVDSVLVGWSWPRSDPGLDIVYERVS